MIDHKIETRIKAIIDDIDIDTLERVRNINRVTEEWLDEQHQVIQQELRANVSSAHALLLKAQANYLQLYPHMEGRISFKPISPDGTSANMHAQTIFDQEWINSTASC